jgi:hypothetical protein
MRREVADQAVRQRPVGLVIALILVRHGLAVRLSGVGIFGGGVCALRLRLVLRPDEAAFDPGGEAPAAADHLVLAGLSPLPVQHRPDRQALQQAVRGDARRQFLDPGLPSGAADVLRRGHELRQQQSARASEVALARAFRWRNSIVW